MWSILLSHYVNYAKFKVKSSSPVWLLVTNTCTCPSCIFWNRMVRLTIGFRIKKILNRIDIGNINHRVVMENLEFLRYLWPEKLVTSCQFPHWFCFQEASREYWKSDIVWLIMACCSVVIASWALNSWMITWLGGSCHGQNSEDWL